MSEASQGPAAPPQTTWWQRLLLLAFGLALLALGEIALRLLGLGGAPPLLSPMLPAADGESALYEIHPRVAAPYFDRSGGGREEMVGGHRREIVALPKPPGQLRILWLGASSIEGFPLPVNLTAARFLETMLQELAGDRPVEVVNLGITAIASFPLREIGLRAFDELDPDLVLVYYGHNEFFGASGVASQGFWSRSVPRMRWRRRLRESAVGQFLRSLVPRRGEGDDTSQRQLIEVMAGQRAIDPEGSLHAIAHQTLAENLGALARGARDRQIPLLLSTVVSLERDLRPIASFPPDAATAEVAGRPWTDAPKLDREQTEGSLREVDEILRRTPSHAGWTFRRGQLLEQLAMPEEAAEAYRSARDLDAMPWRASRDKNSAIRELAAREGVPLVDVEAAFAKTAGGATTWELFYDHVHPSLRGQILLARSVVDGLLASGLFPAEAGAAEDLPDWRELSQRAWAHPLERYLVLHKMATLFRTPPIGHHNEAAAERFESLMEAFRRRADVIDRGAIELWEARSREAGFALPISYFAGRVALDQGALARASFYLQAAIANAYELSDERVAARVLLLEALLRADRRQLFAASLAATREEAARVASLDGQPTALLARCLVLLDTLAGEEVGHRVRRRADRPIGGAPPWTEAFLSALPTTAELDDLLDAPATEAPPIPQ